MQNSCGFFGCVFLFVCLFNFVCSFTPSFGKKVYHSNKFIQTTDTIVIAEALWHYIKAIKCPKSDL